MNEEFAFHNFPVLKTERLTLRRAEEKDSGDLYKLYSKEQVIKYMEFEPFSSVDDAVAEMKWYHRIFEEHTGLRWMIEDPQAGLSAGRPVKAA